MNQLLDLIAQKPALGYSASAASPLIATVAKAANELPMWAVWVAWGFGLVAAGTTVWANVRKRRGEDE